jgi:RNA polymerase-binding transcription factor DksA
MDKLSVRDDLHRMREELRRRLGAIDADLGVALEKDSEERATQVENDEVLREMQTEGINQIAAIDAALERLERGTYGQCVKCKAAIGRHRLAAVPYTPFCIECAKSLD